MRFLSDHLEGILVIAFIAGSLAMFLRLHIVRRRPLVSPEVRELSHRLSNETMQLQARVDRIKSEDDPMDALLRAMTGRRYRHNGQH